jgi:hypothetical protein
MADAISNTSPLLYLHRSDGLYLLNELFARVWVCQAVIDELHKGHMLGYEVPNVEAYAWIERQEPRSLPSEWLAKDLGAGELAVMALALENPDRIAIVDDLLARRTAQSAGLEVWGTLKVLLEAKQRGLIDSVDPWLDSLSQSGMWMSKEIRERILCLAGET